MLNGPVAQLVSFIQSAQYAKISFMRINEIHQLKDEDDSSPVISNSLSLPVDKSLYLKNVSFQYSRNAPLVLKNITLQIPKGKVTAIVGDSGMRQIYFTQTVVASIHAFLRRNLYGRYERE